MVKISFMQRKRNLKKCSTESTKCLYRVGGRKHKYLLFHSTSCRIEHEHEHEVEEYQ